MDITLNEKEVHEAVALYLAKIKDFKDVRAIKIKMRRKASRSEDIGSIVVEFQEKPNDRRNS